MKKVQLSSMILGAILSFSVLAMPTYAAPQTIGIDTKEIAQVIDGTFQAGPNIGVVDIESGKIQGYVEDGIYTYRGIPYATATERFKRAKPVMPWDGTKLMVHNGPISPQSNATFLTDWGQPLRQFKQDNNSQNLNIWTPSVQGAEKKPVMVWLHGGGFSNGSSLEMAAYEGKNLAKHGDVVVVSVNHRLNVMGYLDLSDYGEAYKESGNVGMLDIVDALQWIQRNIVNFGGDPHNVTVFGESGGGAKVLGLLTMPEAKGLFHKAIIESGATETMGVSFNEKSLSKRVSQLTLEKLNIFPEHIEQLQTVPYEDLLQASTAALEEAGIEQGIRRPLDGKLGASWEPVVDGNIMPSHPVLEHGFAKAGKDIPLLIGSNRTEWTNIGDLFTMETSQSNNVNTWTDEEINEKLVATYGDTAEAVVEAFLKAYPNKKRGDALYVDTLIRNPMRKIMTHKADDMGAPVYAYMFTWDSPVMNGIYMTYHTAEIPFVFHNIDLANARIGGGQEAKGLESLMSQAWVNFARYGNPSVPGKIEWKPYTRENGNTMIFDTHSRLVSHHDKELLDLLTPEYTY